MQRQRISGNQLRASASQHVGAINAEKCVIYLRGIGVEIDDATAESWLDAQGVHRFLASGRRPWRTVKLHFCRCGKMQGFSESGRGRMRLPKPKEKRPPARCEDCGSGWSGWSRVFDVLRDGSICDYRKGADAVIPLRLDEWAGGQ